MCTVFYDKGSNKIEVVKISDMTVPECENVMLLVCPKITTSNCPLHAIII